MTDLYQYTNRAIRDTLRPLFKKYGIKRAWLIGPHTLGVLHRPSHMDLFVDLEDGVNGSVCFDLAEDIEAIYGLDAVVSERLTWDNYVDLGIDPESEDTELKVQIYGD